MAKRAALYIRVSSDEQARHGLSLGEQRADLLKYAQAHNYTVVDIYADEGFTARKALSRRRELQRLLNEVRAGAIDLILIKCLDRWFRNIADYYKVQEILDAHGVEWECTQEDYNTTTAQGRLLLNMKLSIAQNESDLTSERIRYVFEGKKERREAVSGRMPIGYKVVDKHIVPDERADIVRYMFESVAGGMSMGRIIGGVYDKFGEKVRYKRMWDCLRNRRYVGEFFGIPDYAPAIIDRVLFQRVQEIMAARILMTPPTGRIYLFAGLVYCPCCGRVLGSNRGKPNKNGEFSSFQYRCNCRLKSRAVDDCTFNHTIFETTLEEYMLTNLQRMAGEHIYIVTEHAKANGKESPQKRIETLEGRKERLKELYLDGLMGKDDYKAEYEAINKELSALSMENFTQERISPQLKQVATADDIRATYSKRRNKIYIKSQRDLSCSLGDAH